MMDHKIALKLEILTTKTLIFFLQHLVQSSQVLSSVIASTTSKMLLDQYTSYAQHCL
jgi:hypothetical protein